MKPELQMEGMTAQLNKIFGSLRSCYSSKVSYILSQLDLSSLLEYVDQRESQYAPVSLLKLYLYKRVKGIKTHPNLIKDLTDNNKNLSLLSLEQIPTKQNFNHFLKTKVTNQLKGLLDRIVEQLLATATHHKIILDIEIVKKNIQEYKNKAREERKVLQESLRILKRLIYPHITINMSKNSRFTTRDLLDILAHIALTHDFAHNGCKTFQDVHEDEDAPDGDTLLYHLKKLDSKEEILKIFDAVTDLLFAFARKHYCLLNKKRIDIAYDVHKIPYYGNQNDEHVKGGKHERGTSYFYQFLTCDIVVAGKRFTIDVMPIHSLDNVDDLLDASLKKIKRKIHIHRAFLDRAFANSKCVKVLRANNVKFIMPIAKNDKIKDWMDKSQDCKARLVEHYLLKETDVNLYLVDDEEGVKRCFITNLKIPVLLAHYFYRWYGKRWGIETGYRLKAQDLKPRTTSKNFTLRLFYFIFSVILYNLWVLVNICVGVTLYSKVPAQPLITTKRFTLMLYKIQAEYKEDPNG